MAFRFFYRTKIRNDFFRLHDNFTKKQYTRTHDLTDHTHHADDIMYLRKISAVGSQLFPDIRNGIDTDDVDTFVSQVQHVVDHFIHNYRIPVVQIPLIWIERRHNEFLYIIQPGEVTRCSCREYLRNGLLKLRRYIVIIIEIVPIHIFAFSGSGSSCPLMIFGCMVHDEIHTQADAFFPALVCQAFQIFHGTQFRLYFSEIADRISAVALSFRRLQ